MTAESRRGILQENSEMQPTRNRRHLVVAVTTMLAVVFGVAFASPALARSQTGRALAASNALNAPKLVWTDCGDGLQCATARVPLDYDHPSGARISLALIRRPATDVRRRIGSLFVNNGGPGNSVLDFVRGDAAQVLSPEVQARFDVVGFDPRGVGQSTPVQCFTDLNHQGEFFGSRPALPVGVDEVRAFTAGSKALGRLCEAREGDLLNHLSTANVARDMDLLRRAVGDEQLTFAGYSYGGLLGVTYANLFPGRVRALMLDGTPDPVEWTRGDSAASAAPFSVRLGSADATSKALGFFLDSCQTAGGGCAFASPHTRAKFKELMARLLEKSVTVETPDGLLEVSYGFLVDGLRGGLTFPPIWAELAGDLEATWQATEQRSALGAPAAAAAQHGRFSSRAKVASAFGSAMSAATVDGYDNSAEALLSIACSETTNPQNPKAWPKLAAKADADAPYFGADWTYLVQPCATWPARDQDRYNGRYTAKTANPLLFVGARFDAASSYEHTRRFVASIPGARLLTLEGAGHPASFVPDKCINDTVSTYLIDQKVPHANTICQLDFRPFE
ncbi:alpha/beta hydrolase [Angustibacter sp. McL0619]|uniref:alpha/beta hydrolase n=1 Tax=Angustibacter sp. McL0619 TaxID=3415676 RepID=UPI003CEBB167